MDFTVKDWLIIIGGLLALAVLLDGYRRMRNERRTAIRLASSRRRRDEVDNELVNPELPGGTARVVAVRETPSLHSRRAGDLKPKSDDKAPPRSPSPKKAPAAPPSALDDEDDDDILFRDPADDYQDAPWAAAEDDMDMGEEADAGPGHHREIDEHQQPDLSEGLSANPEDRAGQVSPSSRSSAVGGAGSKASAAPTAKPAVGQERSQQSTVARKNAKSSAPQQPAQDSSDHQELLVINVVSPKDQHFKGADLLQILLACDVRYGDMNIFHRYEKPDGTGPVQFSIANLVEPGYFELDGIEEFTTPGVVFFMHLPGPENSLKAFTAMEETARCLVTNLGGELRDQSHSVATKQTLEHYRQRIRDFERRQLTLM